MKMSMSVCIKAPKAEVWDVLADVENISLWSSAVITAKTQEVKSGVGTKRTCELANQSTIFEEWTEWTENESYTYQGIDLPMVKHVQNKWSVTSLAEDETLLTTESELVFKGGILGRCLEPMARLASKKLGRQSLAAFKYLVEQKTPFVGKHKFLPKASSIC